MTKTTKPKAKTVAPQERKPAKTSKKAGNIIDVAKHKPKTTA